MERPPRRYFCNKCGYVGISDLHPGCHYFAYPMAHLEQLYIDHLEAELAALRASPASAPEGWKHSCNALCLDGVELWVPQCPHCGKPAPTPPVSEDRWLPIETAPKDGIEVWCYNGEHCVMRWISGEGYAMWVYVDPLLSDADPEPEQPTHWMPLPKAPAMQEDRP